MNLDNCKLFTIGPTLGPVAAVISLSPLAVVACGLIAVGMIAAIWRYKYSFYVMLSQSHALVQPMLVSPITIQA